MSDLGPGAPCPVKGCSGWIRSASREMHDEFLAVRGLGRARIGRIPESEWTYTCTNGHKSGPGAGGR